MASNVLVIPRFRPLNKRELSEVNGADVVVEFESDNKGLVIHDEDKKHRFTFDWVFPPTCTQAEVFHQVAEPLLVDVFNGFNTTIFAYGQTGSGKSHSMTGKLHDPELSGIIPRMVGGIFDRIQQSIDEGGTIEFTVKVSFVEIYNEQIRDLCDTRKDKLRLRESPTGVWIEDVTETYVTDKDHVYAVMDMGNGNRAISSTKMNSESSRSHSVFIISVGQRDTVTNSKKGAKLTLVDLAGSEKVGKTGAEGATLKEAQHINKSLSALGNVINALTSQPTTKGAKPVHIPYRDSKLTYLLSDSLGGNSKTLLIITGSPSKFNVEETLSTIRFGNRAKSIKNKPKANQERTAAEYKKIIDELTAKLEQQHTQFGDITSSVESFERSLCYVPPKTFDQHPLSVKAIKRVSMMAAKCVTQYSSEWLELSNMDTSSMNLDVTTPATDTSIAAVTSPNISVSNINETQDFTLDETSSPWGGDSDNISSVSTPTTISMSMPNSIDMSLLSDLIAEYAAIPDYLSTVESIRLGQDTPRDILFSLALLSKDIATRSAVLQSEIDASDITISVLSEELAALKSSISADTITLKAEIEEYQTKLTTLENELQQLQLEVHDKDDVVTQLRKQNDLSEQRRNNAVRDLRTEIEQIQTEYEETQLKLTETNDKLQSIQSLYDTTLIEKDTLTTQGVELNQTISNFEEIIQEYKTQEQLWQDSKLHLEGQISELSSKVSMYEYARSQELKEYEDGDENSESEQKQGDGEDLLNEDPILAAAKTIAQAEVLKQKHANKSLQQQITNMQEHFDTTLHDINEKHQKDATELRAEQARLFAEIEAKHQQTLKDMHEKQQNDIRKLQNELATLTQQHDESIRILEVGYISKCKEVTSQMVALTLSKSMYHDAEQQLEDISRENVRLSENVSILQKKLSQQEQESDEISKALSAKVAMSSRAIVELYTAGNFWKAKQPSKYSEYDNLIHNTPVHSSQLTNVFSQTPTSLQPNKPRINPSNRLHSGGGLINPKFDTNQKKSSYNSKPISSYTRSGKDGMSVFF